MFKTWTASAEDLETAARELEAHLNEYADEVVAVTYAVAGAHRVLAVYKPVEAAGLEGEAEAVVAVEEMLEGLPPKS